MNKVTRENARERSTIPPQAAELESVSTFESITRMQGEWQATLAILTAMSQGRPL